MQRPTRRVRASDRSSTGESITLLLMAFAGMLLAIDSGAWWMFVVTSVLFAMAVWFIARER